MCVCVTIITFNGDCLGTLDGGKSSEIKMYSLLFPHQHFNVIVYWYLYNCTVSLCRSSSNIGHGMYRSRHI